MSRHIDSSEIRDRSSVLRQVVSLLPPSVVAEMAVKSKGPNQTWVIRGERGQLLAQFHDHAFAEFTLQAPGHLRALVDYVEQLEQDAFYDRERRRDVEARLDEVTNELLAADGLGIKTKDGQRRVQSAIASVKDRRSRRRPY